MDHTNINRNDIVHTYGISRPQGIAQINSINVPRVSTEVLYCSGEAFIFGCVKTPLNVCSGIILPLGSGSSPSINFANTNNGIYSDGTSIIFSLAGTTSATVSAGGIQTNTISSQGNSSLSLNPGGSYIDCNWKTLINVGGIIPQQGGGGAPSNPNCFTITSTGPTQTTNSGVANVLSVQTSANTVYLLTTSIVCANDSDGSSAAGFIFSAVAKNINGVVSVGAIMEKNVAKDSSLSTTNASYTVSGSQIFVTVQGTSGSTLNWFATTNVLRQLF